MVGDGGGGGETIANGALALLGSPAVRNATLTCLAAAGVALSVRSILNGKPPRVPSKDDRYDRQGQRAESRRAEDVAGTYTEKRSSRASSTASVLGYGSSSIGHGGLGGGSSAGTASSSKNAIAIFWDVDNCAPNTGASGHQVAQAIRRAAQSTGPDPNRLGSIVSFKAYLELSSETNTPNATQVQLRSELQGSGVSLIDTPKSGRKDVADKMMIADLLSFAIDKRPPALIVLLSGDRDFAYPLGILRNRGYEILLITPPAGATPILEASANYTARWRQDVLGIDYDASGRPYDKLSSNRSAARTNTVETTNSVPTSLTKSTLPPTNLIPDSVKEQDQKNSVPPVFQSLVNVLEEFRKEGQHQPLRSRVSARLQSMDPGVFVKAHASGWGEFVAVAEAAGFVNMGFGSQPGREWIGLPDSFPSAPIRPSNLDTWASSSSSSNWNNQNIAVFYPLIEVHKSLKAASSSGKDPSAREISERLDEMIRQNIADPYTQAGIGSFKEYIKLAFHARVARLSGGDTDDSPSVQLYPKVATMHTNAITLSNATTRMLDTANVLPPPPLAPKQSKLTALLMNRRQSSDQGSGTVAQRPVKDDKKVIPSLSTKAEKQHPHQPSGEVISVIYFPLANLLLTKRSEGSFSTRDSQVHQALSKHHRLGRMIQSWTSLQAYLKQAEADDIVRLIEHEDEVHVQLADRLCKGEGEDRHKGFSIGTNSTWSKAIAPGDRKMSASSGTDAKVSSSLPPRPTTNGQSSASTEEVAKTPFCIPKHVAEPSEQFDTVKALPSDRQKYKVLVEALVALRKRGTARVATMHTLGDSNGETESLVIRSAVEPLRSSVTTFLCNAHASNGSDSNASSEHEPKPAPIAPGVWLQRSGFASFADFYNEAERKGFVHLLSHDGFERVRLAERYEEMFFPNQ